MVTRASRRLPGFRFEYQPPAPTDVLPRMDVAVFVGIAASGPLDVPVAVEDVTQFTTIFGDDLPLAWDTERSEQVYAYLAPTVRAFFRNGGQRCWVIRVAGDDAQYSYFPITGLAQVNDARTLTPAFARARSQGSWADDMRVSATLTSSPISASQLVVSDKGISVNLALISPGDVSEGDLVRLALNDGEYTLMLSVASVQAIDAPPASPPDGLAHLSMVTVTSSAAYWFKSGPPRSPLPAPRQAFLFAHDGPLSALPVSCYQEDDTQDQPITLYLDAPLSNAPQPGAMMRVDFDDDQLWMMVQQVHVEQCGSPPSDQVVVGGWGVWLLAEQDIPNLWPSAISQAEQLSITLWAQQGNGFPLVLSDLTFCEDHPSFWKALPTDEQLYRDSDMTTDPTHSLVTKTLSYSSYTELWQKALNPRFPLAGDDAQGTFYLPIAMPTSPDYYLGLDTGASGKLATPRKRDGLLEFSTNLFLDMDMVESLTTDLMMQADYLRYTSTQPRSLKGIYAALSIEEAAIIAVPDAYQLGWVPAFAGLAPPPQDSEPLPHPERWHCQQDIPDDIGQSSGAMATATTTTPGSQPAKERYHRDYPRGYYGSGDRLSIFQNCDVQVIAPPVLQLLEGPDDFGTFRLGWEEQVDGTVIYILEEALRPDWVDAAVIYQGPNQFILLYGRGQGDYFYRVRVMLVDDSTSATAPSSDWSAGLAVRVETTGLWHLEGIEAYDAQDLLALQRCLARMCAARGDLFAVLALPEHYHEDEAIVHIAQLKSLVRSFTLHTSDDPTIDDPQLVFPLNYGERSAFSYTAVYYPWVVTSEEANPLQRIPPDGTACGIMALRANARGAWVAPANELMTGVVDLSPRIGRASWQRLQDAQINLVRQDARGFLCLSSDTLGDDEDEDLRPINVRRLLILLRRMALREGATYVFESNSYAFRRLVQRGFEAMLGDMFMRGAFAGSTPATSFQVVTDTSINTPQSVDLGRFIVELKVAPSLPMTFLTVRLLQSATGGTITEGQ
jgi:hypothetical protein